jgi:putative membrane protein
MMWGTDGWMHGYWWLVGLGSWIVIVLAAVLAAAIWGARKRPGRDAAEAGGPSETPLEILRKRYARGDISREQFEQVRRELA